MVPSVVSWRGRSPGKPWEHGTWYLSSIWATKAPSFSWVMSVSFAAFEIPEQLIWGKRKITVIAPCPGATEHKAGLHISDLIEDAAVVNFQHFAGFYTHLSQSQLSAPVSGAHSQKTSKDMQGSKRPWCTTGMWMLLNNFTFTKDQLETFKKPNLFFRT